MSADLRHLEHVAHVDGRNDLFLLLRREHPFERLVDVVDGVVDDVVRPDVDLFLLCQTARVQVRADTEADDDGIRRRGQDDIRFGDRADAAVDDVQLHFLVLDLHERIRECFHRTVHVALHDDTEFLDLAVLDLARDVVQRRQMDLAEVLLALELLTAERDLACHAVGVHHA